jgi:hypothetical protein
MTIDLQAERLYDQIELVRGVGSRQRGRLCIMSLVAFLAGDHHTDRPRTASSFIRNFVIQLNDRAPDQMRADLKPFAPRIIGTSDGRDIERATLLFRVIETEVVPRATNDFLNGDQDNLFELSTKSRLRVSALWGDKTPSECLATCLCVVRDEYEHRNYLSLATRAGEFFATLMRLAPNQTKRRWYWAKALQLVDRLCDIGADAREGVEAMSVAKEHANAAVAEGSYAAPESAERRPMQRISHILRTALDLLSA